MLPKNRTKAIIFSVVILVTMLIVGYLAKNYFTKHTISKQGFYFDTVIEISLYNSGDETLVEECFNRVAEYEKHFSRMDVNSDISRISSAAGESVEVDECVIELLKAGVEYSKQSKGTFDITVGALSKVWDINTIKDVNRTTLPSEEEIKNALATVDYKEIVIDEDNNTVALNNPDAVIDLGALAKGYVADKLKAFLNEKGATEGIINFGGNVLTLGPKEKKENYKIGIQKPFSEEGEMIDTLSVVDKSVVTSGRYQRYFETEGKKYHHIMDLSTGYPVDNELDSVTIISDSSLDGDAYSTICFCLGIEKAKQLLAEIDNVDAVFVDNEGNITDTRDIKLE